MEKMNIVVFGLSITSWANDHAITYRSLLKALAARGHQITFFELTTPVDPTHRDMASPSFCRTVLYRDTDELEDHITTIAQADLVIMGSHIQCAGELADKITTLAPPCFAYYDLDTPATLANLDNGNYECLHPSMIPRFDIYLSSSGGPLLNKLERKYGAQSARPLYCSADPDLYHPSPTPYREKPYALGYIGDYSSRRQLRLEELLIGPAEARSDILFCVDGSQYPDDINWPENIDVTNHIPPHQQRDFFYNQSFSLNVTCADRVVAGYSPSARLFEAAACGIPIISDYWQGLESFFEIGKEILIAENRDQVLQHLALPEEQRVQMGHRLREKIMQAHTSAHRAQELETYWQEVTEPLMYLTQQHYAT